MICPQCKAEYRAGFTHCVDCDVDLVKELPKNAIYMRRSGGGAEFRPSGEPGDPNEDPFCSFWKGDDPRVHGELCEVLDEAGIPHNTVYRRDHLFNLRNYAAFEVGVPFSMYERAENVVKEAYGTDDIENVGAHETPLLADKPSRLVNKLPETLTASDEEGIPGPPTAGENEAGWHPEDATVKVWSTEKGGSSDFLVAALHENEIRCRVEQNGVNAELYVLPADESRAREIVREVVEGRPPE
ncbi:MAG TPA: hypothetical protein VMH20_16065 [Verrucomicrobiae bacterium]|nr:hypothetical protein [Verrucomicrobiae bacterium]